MKYSSIILYSVIFTINLFEIFTYPIIIYNIKLSNNPIIKPISKNNETLPIYNYNPFKQQLKYENNNTTNNFTNNLSIYFKNNLIFPFYQYNKLNNTLLYGQLSNNGLPLIESTGYNQDLKLTNKNFINLSQISNALPLNSVTNSWPTSKKNFLYYIGDVPDAPKSFNNYINGEVWRALYQYVVV